MRQHSAEPADAVSSHLCRRVKQLRDERGWSLDSFSKACGVSRSMLSQIERNQTNPTLAVMFRIAQAFGMSLGQLVETPGATSNVDVIRASDRAYHYRSDKDCEIRTLSPLHLEKDVEFYEVTLQPGGALVIGRPAGAVLAAGALAPAGRLGGALQRIEFGHAGDRRGGGEDFGRLLRLRRNAKRDRHGHAEVSPRCISIDLSGRPQTSVGACS